MLFVAIGATWLVGAPLAAIASADCLGLWSAVAIVFLMVGQISYLAHRQLSALASSVWTPVVAGLGVRMAVIGALSLYLMRASWLPASGLTGPVIAFSLMPYYFALLAVEVLSAPTILTGSPPSTRSFSSKGRASS